MLQAVLCPLRTIRSYRDGYVFNVFRGLHAQPRPIPSHRALASRGGASSAHPAWFTAGPGLTPYVEAALQGYQARWVTPSAARLRFALTGSVMLRVKQSLITSPFSV